MRNPRNKKTINFKLILGVFVLVFLLLIVVLSLFFKKDRSEKLDYKFGIVANDGVALVSISKDRKMINVLNLDKEVKVWIPDDGNWYQNIEVKDVLKKEKKTGVAENVFWYNFGFVTDKILTLNSVDQWKDDSILISNLGLFGWIDYKINYGKMFLKQEKITGDLVSNETFLDEIMPRDFSESKLNNEELRLSVFNNTSESGLAGFMSKRLEWSGFSVVSEENDSEKINKCLIIYGDKADLNYGWKIINKLFDCDKRYDETLNENELEIYFGDSLASMIKYSSYSNSNK